MSTYYEPKFRYEVYDRNTRNSVAWFPTREQAIKCAQAWNREGFIVFDNKTDRELFRMHGPMVAP